MLIDREDYELSKRYYSIAEVAEMFGVSKSLVRYWEGEFDFLRPAKSGRGDRRFTQENIGQLRLIYELVKERGFTLEGAKKEIGRHRSREQEKSEMIARLKTIRAGLKGLQHALAKK